MYNFNITPTTSTTLPTRNDDSACVEFEIKS